MRLENRTALITGGANGIGAAIARHYLEEGASVFIVDREIPDATTLEAYGRKYGPARIKYFVGDILNPFDIDAACKTALDAFGRIDILVNNAGGSGTIHAPSIEETSDEAWAQVIDLNVTSILRFSRHLIPGMKQGGWGRIINMSSRSRNSVPKNFPTMKNHLGYVVAKGAIVSMTAQFARELGPYNIRCNAIAPGLILPDPDARITRIFEAQPEEWQRGHIANIPAGRAGNGDDIGALAVYLASPESDYMTGQTIDINGGAR